MTPMPNRTLLVLISIGLLYSVVPVAHAFGATVARNSCDSPASTRGSNQIVVRGTIAELTVSSFTLTIAQHGSHNSRTVKVTVAPNARVRGQAVAGGQAEVKGIVCADAILASRVRYFAAPDKQASQQQTDSTGVTPTSPRAPKDQPGSHPGEPSPPSKDTSSFPGVEGDRGADGQGHGG